MMDFIEKARELMRLARQNKCRIRKFHLPEHLVVEFVHYYEGRMPPDRFDKQARLNMIENNLFGKPVLIIADKG